MVLSQSDIADAKLETLFSNSQSLSKGYGVLSFLGVWLLASNLDPSRTEFIRTA
jgi:hypothetical protein